MTVAAPQSSERGWARSKQLYAKALGTEPNLLQIDLVVGIGEEYLVAIEPELGDVMRDAY